ncbi:hypothetical protein [Anaerospora hongkongensis]|uniref:hypothetical protein n=1 Tax=Anaerospora hongkongensis TaxID=244830 RepID=UPI00289B6AFF|nr:hypothetical protein [Anaerospora hongkongensis]
MDNKESLFYKPDLQPERDYHSDALIPEQGTTTVVVTPEETTPAKDRLTQLIEDLEEIKEVAQFLPGDLPAIIEGPINPIIEQIKIIFPEGEPEPSDVPITEVYNPEVEESLPDLPPVLELIDEYEYLDPELPELLPNSTAIKIEIITPKSLVEIAENTYKQDLIDLKEDYTKKLQTVMQRYLQDMIMIMSETGLSDIAELTRPYDGTAVIIRNPNLKHLGDYIVRSQVVREQKTRLFKKTHNIDQTMMHIRSLYAAEKQRERYYAAKYGDSETYLNSQSNTLLRESRAQYNKKYNQSLYDVYKYLNASVMIIDDTLAMSKKESQAKGTLLKNGVNIYATQESIAMSKAETAKK